MYTRCVINNRTRLRNFSKEIAEKLDSLDFKIRSDRNQDSDLAKYQHVSHYDLSTVSTNASLTSEIYERINAMLTVTSATISRTLLFKFTFYSKHKKNSKKKNYPKSIEDSRKIDMHRAR